MAIPGLRQMIMEGLRAAGQTAERAFPRVDRASAGIFVPASPEHEAMGRAFEQRFPGNRNALWDEHMLFHGPTTNEQWATEIPDDASRIRFQHGSQFVNERGHGTMTLPDAWDHPLLYDDPQVGPALRDLKIDISPHFDGGYRYEGGDSPYRAIVMPENALFHPLEGRPKIAHEAYHGVADIAGFAPGSTPTQEMDALTPDSMRDFWRMQQDYFRNQRDNADFRYQITRDPVHQEHAEFANDVLNKVELHSLVNPFDLASQHRYLHKPGETAARRVANRIDYTMDERRAIRPWDTPDNAWRQAIYRALGLGIRGGAAGAGLGLAYGATQNALNDRPVG